MTVSNAKTETQNIKEHEKSGKKIQTKDHNNFLVTDFKEIEIYYMPNINNLKSFFKGISVSYKKTQKDNSNKSRKTIHE